MRKGANLPRLHNVYKELGPRIHGIRARILGKVLLPCFCQTKPLTNFHSLLTPMYKQETQGCLTSSSRFRPDVLSYFIVTITIIGVSSFCLPCLHFFFLVISFVSARLVRVTKILSGPQVRESMEHLTQRPSPFHGTHFTEDNSNDKPS